MELNFTEHLINGVCVCVCVCVGGGALLGIIIHVGYSETNKKNNQWYLRKCGLLTDVQKNQA